MSGHGGAVVPGSLTVVYHFSYDALVDAHGVTSSCEDLAEEANHKRLRTLLSYRHEQIHLRHLCASPFGFLTWVLQNADYEMTARALQPWGQRRSNVESKLPIQDAHASDPEIVKLGNYKQAHANTVHVLRWAKGISGFDAAAALRFGIDECASVLQRKGIIPVPAGALDVDVGSENADVVGALFSGDDVIEGHARANDYAMAILLGCGKDQMNRLVLELDGDLYGRVRVAIEKGLGIPFPHSILPVAQLCDWALQVPLLPWLRTERTEVGIAELLPSWRLGLLLTRCMKLGIGAADLTERARSVEERLFGDLGWMSPSEIARRTLDAKLGTSDEFPLRLALKKLTDGAKLRLEHPELLARPQESQATLDLEMGIAFFADSSIACAPELRNDPSWYELPVTLIEHLILDRLWAGPNLGNAYDYAAIVGPLVKIPGKELVARKMRAILGPGTARSIALHDTSLY